MAEIDRLRCSICRDLLRDPATAPCGHSFCRRCVQDRWDGDRRGPGPCSCPACGRVFPCRPRLTGIAAPGPVRDAGRRPGALCRRHGCSLDVYCCTEEQIVCAVCAAAEHTGHTFGSVRVERMRKQEELKTIQIKSRWILQKQEKKLKNMGKTLEQIPEEVKKTQDYCESVLASVIDSIQRRYLSVRELIGAQAEAAAAQVQISSQTLQVKMEKMRKRSHELDQLAQTDSDVHFLEKWPSLRRLCIKDHLHHFQEVSEDPLLPLEFTKRAVEQLGRQLQEFCDIEFASISQTADSGEQQESGGETEEDDMQQSCEASTSKSHGFPGVNSPLTEQNVEPKTRAEFLKYACDLSLDPTTAHEDLTISVGGKEARLSLHKSKPPAIRSPERFTQRRQVLCREGLQAERCYYEIEVKGGKAEIALAYKGINRKSFAKMSAFGANENSWSLDCSTNYSVSHKADSVQLKTSPSHHRVGVYLKFKEGTLSFYEVSDSMKFLHKVEAEFTEPLYPGFWLGEKCCIRICDLRRDGL